jgi:hypothetical protein
VQLVLILLSSGRLAALWSVFLSQTVRRRVLSQHVMSQITSTRALSAILVPVLINAGFMSLFFASLVGDVSLVTPFVGLHTTLPTLAGMAMGESRRPMKLAGVAVSAVAVVLFGAEALWGG